MEDFFYCLRPIAERTNLTKADKIDGNQRKKERKYSNRIWCITVPIVVTTWIRQRNSAHRGKSTCPTIANGRKRKEIRIQRYEDEKQIKMEREGAQRTEQQWVWRWFGHEYFGIVLLRFEWEANEPNRCEPTTESYNNDDDDYHVLNNSILIFYVPQQIISI